MKKTILLLFLSIFLFYSKLAHSQFLPFYENKTSTNALSMMALKGKVKSVQQTSYKAIDKGGVIQKGEKENISSGITSGSDFIIQFDNTGRATEETFSSHSAEIKYSDQTTYLKHTLNEQTNTETVEESEAPEPGKVRFKYVYKYDTKGSLIEQLWSQLYSGNGSYDTKFTFKYNASGKLSEKNIASFDGSSIKTIYKYDDKGNLTSQEGYKKGNVLAYLETFKADAKGNVVEHNYYNADCKTIDHTFNFKYDTSNNIIQKEYYATTNRIVKKAYSYKYEYDKTGNWIKRTDLEDGKATFIIERKFEYY